jgi:hypothetical protein
MVRLVNVLYVPPTLAVIAFVELLFWHATGQPKGPWIQYGISGWIDASLQNGNPCLKKKKNLFFSKNVTPVVTRRGL